MDYFTQLIIEKAIKKVLMQNETQVRKLINSSENKQLSLMIKDNKLFINSFDITENLSETEIKEFASIKQLIVIVTINKKNKLEVDILELSFNQ